MDGVQRRLRESVQLRLSFWLSVAILAVALAAGVFASATAFNEAHELQDDLLRQVAALFDRQRLSLPPADKGGRASDADEDARVIVQYLGADGAAPGARLPLPPAMPDGLHTLTLGGEAYRIFVKRGPGGDRIAVAQQAGLRDDIARDSALRTVMPLLVLVPVLLLVVATLVRRMFRPIAVLAGEIDRRGEQALHPVDAASVPAEVRPFVGAINRLLDRVAQSMEAQRRFVADAAHELRSPLTALSLQAERLADAEMSAAARTRLQALRQGIERGRQLLDQLLALARAQSAPPLPAAPISVLRVYRRVLEDLMPQAEAKQIDIGVEAAGDVQVPVSDGDLAALVKNLVDNAIRYTPAGGRIDLAAKAGAGHAILQVSDSGPGIPAAERARVFDPFYRMLGSDAVGSGLGLSIVKTIAARIGAELRLAYADEAAQTGLCVTLRIPTAASMTT